MKAILLDIEGTTTDISFVYETLFPYARRDFEATFEGGGILGTRWDEPEIQKAVSQLAGGIAKASPHAAAGAALALMSADIKDTGLKALQGLIWDAGYQNGELKGHVYSDLLPLLKRTQAQGIPVAIYSSGSIHAQKLIFGHSIEGDLRPYIQAYFDTTTGPKVQALSYLLIARDLKIKAQDILFVTDHLGEAEAAKAAGMQVRVALRRRPEPIKLNHGFLTLTNFDGLLP